MSEQNETPATGLPRPITNDSQAWKAYWKQAGQPWRTQQEIPSERQHNLEKRLRIAPHIQSGTYPFKGIKLNRADIEWLLSIHEGGKGYVDWNDPDQRERAGLDLRGADLNGEDLSGLPLARLRGGLTGQAYKDASPKECEIAAIHLEGALLIQTHLEGAYLNSAHLKEANLYQSFLEYTEFRSADLKDTHLNETHLGGANFRHAHLEGANLQRANLKEEGSSPTKLQAVYFNSATNLKDILLGNEEHGYTLLSDINWGGVNLSRVDWSHIHKSGEEYVAQQAKDGKGEEKGRTLQIAEYQAAARTNQQLTTVLASQGMNEEAVYFAYRAKVNQRHLLLLKLFQHVEAEPRISWLARKSRKPLSDPSLDSTFGITLLRAYLGAALLCLLLSVFFTFLPNEGIFSRNVNNP